MPTILQAKNVLAKPIIEYRAMPTLLEQRNIKITELEGIVNTAKNETRSMNEEEQQKFEQVKQEIEQIDKTIQADQQAQSLANDPNAKTIKSANQEEKRALEDAETKFLRFVRGEERALDVAGNGGIIPTQIADRIITRVKELSPIYSMATIFNVGGDLVFPKFDINSINTAYIADMIALTPQNGNFTTIKLQNFIAGSLVQISRSLMNRSDFDLLGFIVNAMANSIANFLEKELLTGTGTAGATGIFNDASATLVTAGTATTLSLDDLINVQLSIPEQYQGACAWIMNKSIFSGFRKLKDTQGLPLLLPNTTRIQGGFGWEMLGRPVYVSENAPSTVATGAKVLSYGDFSGLYVKLAQNIEIQVLNELYSVNHAVGCVGHIEFDAKIVEDQKIAVLKMA